MKEKRRISIKSSMIGIVLMCWLIPLLLIVGINIYYISGNHFDNTVSKQLEQLKFNDRISTERLNKVIQLSRKASYDGTIVKQIEKYRDGMTRKRNLLQLQSTYLRAQYGNEDSVKMAILWDTQEPEQISSSTYNESIDGTYQQVQNYWEKDHEAMKEYAQGLDTSVGFYSSGTHCYLVRNLLNQSYEEVAVLVLLLNTDYCFENYDSFAAETSVTLHVNDCVVNLSDRPVDEKEVGIEEIGGNAGYRWENGTLWLFHTVNGTEYQLTSLVRFDDSSPFGMFYGYKPVLIGMALCLIPLLLLFLYVFDKHVTKPMEALIKGAREVENGNLGYCLAEEPKSVEFQYLAESFNEMSGKLKYQFDHIYEEELALRDAKIMALQSHINPHFMNNTLEIINWEARLSGNQKVSQMIEALSTLMDATIDRKRQPEVLLSEEMIYVNAYLYIIAERLGKRLTIKKDLPKEIMQCKVPRLILQPVIENAVEHGVVRNGQGTVEISGHLDGSFLYLEIINESVLTKEEEERVERLLDITYDTSKEPSGNMGIANVNQRLRILYGPPCGLSIKKEGTDHIKAQLTILVGK